MAVVVIFTLLVSQIDGGNHEDRQMRLKTVRVKNNSSLCLSLFFNSKGRAMSEVYYPSIMLGFTKKVLLGGAILYRMQLANSAAVPSQPEPGHKSSLATLHGAMNSLRLENTTSPANPCQKLTEWIYSIRVVGGLPRAQLWIGSPPQPATLLLDTGSPFTWVQSGTSTPASAPNSDGSTPLYNPNNSITWKPDGLDTGTTTSFAITYLDSNSCAGYIGEERISLDRDMNSSISVITNIGLGTNCSDFGKIGIMGLDRNSDLLKAFATQYPDKPLIMAFNLDKHTNGHYYFGIDTYAGLTADKVIWSLKTSKLDSFDARFQWTLHTSDLVDTNTSLRRDT